MRAQAVPSTISLSRIGAWLLLVASAILLSPVYVAAQTATLAWDRNAESDVTGYTVYWGTTPGVYPNNADAGNQTTFVISGLAVERAYYAAVQAYTASGLRSELSAPVQFLALGPPPPGPRRDVNQDGRPDLIWHHDTQGYVAAWLMAGERLTDSVLTTPGRVADTGWKIVGAGDFNRDGKTDLVWQHRVQGYLAVWLMNGTTLIESASISPDRVADTRWRIATVADINGDGYSDLVWQESSQGWLAVWLMNGTRMDTSRSLAPERVDPTWQIRAAADVNGDGKQDLIWQHRTEGWLAAWLMNGMNVVEGRAFAPERVADPRWKIVGAGDANGDGHTDLYWREDASGSLGLWIMNYTRLRTSLGLQPDKVADLGWKVVGVK